MPTETDIKEPQTKNEQHKEFLAKLILADSSYKPVGGLYQIALQGLMKLSNNQLNAIQIVVSCKQ